MTNSPPLPDNIGKKRSWRDQNGTLVTSEIVDEIKMTLSINPEMAIYLQKFQYKHDGSIELRFGYYIIGKKPRMAGKWVWGQYAPMIPQADFEQIVRIAQDKGMLTI
jgi:hypothetical protein